MDHVAITTHPHPSNDSTGYKNQLERHPATIRIVVKKLASSIKGLPSIHARACQESLVVSNCHSDGLLVDQQSVYQISQNVTHWPGSLRIYLCSCSSSKYP